MHREITHDRKDTKSSRGGSVSGGVFIKLMHQPKVISEKKFPAYVLWVKNNPCKELLVGKLFGYLQCDIEVPDYLRRFFWSFSPICKNTVVSKEGNGTLMREYTEKEKNFGLAQKNP